MDPRQRGDDGNAGGKQTYAPLPDDAVASNRRTADALGRIKGVGDLPRFTVDAINAHGDKAIREVADLIGQVHARSPDQARELFARTADGISPANRAALTRLGSGPHEGAAAPESDGTRNPSADLPPAQARKQARETVGERSGNINHMATEWHYEDRDAKNTPLPSSIDEAEKMGFERYRTWQNAEHQNEKGKPEIKFGHPDGREIVFDGDTGKIVDDPMLRGTYNYVTPPPFGPEGESPSRKEWEEYLIKNYEQLPDLIIRGLGHGAADVVPYWTLRNDRVNR